MRQHLPRGKVCGGSRGAAVVMSAGSITSCLRSEVYCTYLTFAAEVPASMVGLRWIRAAAGNACTPTGRCFPPDDCSWLGVFSE